MKEYTYKNATVYITEPTEEHMKNIRKATELFLKKVIKEDTLNEHGTNNRRTSRSNINARKRNK